MLIENRSEIKIETGEPFIHPDYLSYMERVSIRFCQQASTQCEAELNEWFGDPRSAFGAKAIKDAQQFQGGYVPSWDSREYSNKSRKGGINNGR